MTHHDESHMEILRELLEGQLLGVLGTHHGGEPYTSLVGFAATPDLAQLLFTTGRATRKHANLVADARASMLIDNRSNRPADFTEASAATAVGVVEEVGEAERAGFEGLFLAKHPHLESFVRSPSCVPLRLRVSVYMVVTRFQHVIELHVDR
jgi:putative heme iron utilization protein